MRGVNESESGAAGGGLGGVGNRDQVGGGKDAATPGFIS